MKPAPFEYHAPASAEEAVDLLASLGDEAKVLAGGQSLIPMLALRLAVFEHLIDVGRIESLRGIERRNGPDAPGSPGSTGPTAAPEPAGSAGWPGRDGRLWIGAGTTEAAVERSAEVTAAVPLLARATPYVGHVQIRNRGTVGGSIAHADPAAEYPAVALALDAEMEVLSPRGRRTVPAADFFTGLWSTSLEPDELLVGVTFPVWSGGRCGWAVEEVARRHGDFAIAGATVGVELDPDDRVRRCAIGLIGLGSAPERAAAAEREVTGRPLAEIAVEELGHLAMEGLGDVPSDLHGSAAYRTRVGATMVARAWTAAGTEARDGGAPGDGGGAPGA